MEERRVTLSSDSAPLVFPGELPVHATPRGEAVTDLNLMVRRARCAARLVPGTVSQSQPLAGNVGTRLILALGKLTLQVAGEDALELAALDAAVLEPGCGCELASGAQGTVTRFYCGEITSVANRDA
jgi:environmental stress-induced protein Ves